MAHTIIEVANDSEIPVIEDGSDVKKGDKKFYVKPDGTFMEKTIAVEKRYGSIANLKQRVKDLDENIAKLQDERDEYQALIDEISK